MRWPVSLEDLIFFKKKNGRRFPLPFCLNKKKMPTLFCTMLLSSAVQTTKGSDFESFFKPSAYLTAILTTGETLYFVAVMRIEKGFTSKKH